ncbi:hypothetical protein ALC60_12631 [Trachymyrmex zeteki]|uniref:Uncharacterized protein n=1 Tax=Mycetomoellerius zeteki TaxID=64791 RepID=A0A151WK99_9HYME|nr:hypothetical protein ALC60_12631 [Trachymyrmex zeteki]
MEKKIYCLIGERCKRIILHFRFENISLCELAHNGNAKVNSLLGRKSMVGHLGNRMCILNVSQDYDDYDDDDDDNDDDDDDDSQENFIQNDAVMHALTVHA